jgi:hypothetical protein
MELLVVFLSYVIECLLYDYEFGTFFSIKSIFGPTQVNSKSSELM